MAALTKPYESFERPGLVTAYKMASIKIYKGALVGVNSSGLAVAMAHGTASLRFVGIANETVDNTANSGKTLNVTKSGSFVFAPYTGYTPAAADVGAEIYGVTDWEVQLSTSGLTNAYKVGTVTALEKTSTGASGVRVRIDKHSV